MPHSSGNTRNGRSKKTLKGEFGELPIEVPRDRQGTFEPLIVPKHQTHWHGIKGKILSLYARGLSVRDIQAHLLEMYGAEVSPSLISAVTDAVMEEVDGVITPPSGQPPGPGPSGGHEKRPGLATMRLTFVFQPC